MLEELKKINFQSGRDEIIYFLCKVIGASSINRNDAIVLCNHAPGKHHLSCDDLITYCSAFGWIRFSENILSLADDLIQLVEDNNQTNNYLIQSTVNFMYDADIFSINIFYYDSVQLQLRFKNESFPLKLSSV